VLRIVPYNWKAVARTVCFTLAALIGLLEFTMLPGRVNNALHFRECGTVVITMLFIDYVGITVLAVGLILHAASRSGQGDKFQRRQAAALLALLMFLAPIMWMALAEGIAGLMRKTGITGYNHAWLPVGPLIQVLISGVGLVCFAFALVGSFRPKERKKDGKVI